MFKHSRSWMLAVATCLTLACAACQSRTATKPAEDQPAPVVQDAATPEQPSPLPTEKPAHKPPIRKTEPNQTASFAAVPKVVLSDELRATCLVNVGDTMPNAELPDLTGKIHTLDSLFGQELTVVCFWTLGTTHRSQLVALSTLQDLMKDVSEPFGEKGVRVVGVNVGDLGAAVQREVAEAGATFPNLLDPHGEYFAKIAKDQRMPRTFLLDAGGRILWFDVEYSRFTRRDLMQGVRAALGEP